MRIQSQFPEFLVTFEEAWPLRWEAKVNSTEKEIWKTTYLSMIYMLWAFCSSLLSSPCKTTQNIHSLVAMCADDTTIFAGGLHHIAHPMDAIQCHTSSSACINWHNKTSNHSCVSDKAGVRSDWWCFDMESGHMKSTLMEAQWVWVQVLLQHHTQTKTTHHWVNEKWPEEKAGVLGQ